MKLSSKVAELTELIEPAVNACDVALWGIEFLPQGRRSLLRVFIEATPEDKAQSKQVTIEDCAAVTHQINGVLDVHDPIAGEYLLEVSSPGLDRSFFYAEQLHDYIGQTLSLRLIQAIGTGSDKRRKVTGALKSIGENDLVVTAEPHTNPHDYTIRLDNIDKANLVYSFDD